MERGLIHIYCGDGKGKTTAAVGLSIRAAGCGRRVVFAQFFKDGNSGECCVLEKLPNIIFLRPEKSFGFFWTLSEAEKAAARAFYTAHLQKALNLARGAHQLVLYEAMSACAHGMLDEEALLAFLRTKPEGLEVVLTGRDPSPAMQDAADYVTEMKKIKHPFDRGIPARKGVEF